MIIKVKDKILISAKMEGFFLCRAECDVYDECLEFRDNRYNSHMNICAFTRRNSIFNCYKILSLYKLMYLKHERDETYVL